MEFIMKFKVGQKVKIKEFERLELGEKGYVEEMIKYIGEVGVVENNEIPYSQLYRVKFEDGNYWFFKEMDLTLVDDKKSLKRAFEIVSTYKNTIDESFIPERSDNGSAGYDLRAAEDIVIPSIIKQRNEAFSNAMETSQTEGHESLEYAMFEEGYIPTLDEVEALTKEYNLRATLVPTGLKAKFPEGESLDVIDRSSIGVKALLSLPHSVGIVDSSYYNNPNNEGHIMVPLVNHLPFDIKIQKGERIAQAIFRPYIIKDNDKPLKTERTGGVGSSGR